MTDTTTPSRYVIHYSFVQCSNCGHCTRESKFLALSFIRSRSGTGMTRHLEPIARPQYNLPVDKVLTGCHKIPYCQACDHVNLSHLPPPPSAAALTDLPEPVLRTVPTKKPAGTRQPPRKPTLEELA